MNKKRAPKSEKKQINIKHVRVGKLNTIEQVAKLQARLIKKGVKAGKAGGGDVVNDSYKLVMMASMLVKTLEVSDLESRVEALEERAINK